MRALATHPIKDREKLNLIADEIYEAGHAYYVMFELCINTGSNCNTLYLMNVAEAKRVVNTGILRMPLPSRNVKVADPANFGIYITKEMINLLDKLIDGRDESEQLFSPDTGFKSITIYSRTLNTICKKHLGVPLSPAAFKKTFGYWYYTFGGDERDLFKFLNLNCRSRLYEYIEVDVSEED